MTSLRVACVLGLLAAHPTWGIIALPLLARLYIREKTLAAMAPTNRPLFRTKLELAVELMRWAKMPSVVPQSGDLTMTSWATSQRRRVR